MTSLQLYGQINQTSTFWSSAEDLVWAKTRILGSLPRTKGDFKKSIERIFSMILNPFFFHAFGVRRYIDVLDPEN